MIANVGYSVTIGRYDPTILARALVADVGVPLFLTACAPAVFGRSSRASVEGE